MRLLDAETKRLQSFEPDAISTLKYAILSHTWLPVAQEVTFQDLTAPRRWKLDTGPPTGSPMRAGWKKLAGACEQTLKDGLRYIWIDTCCIDKSSTAELSEAINSMFAWYAGAEVCYAYLADVRVPGDTFFDPDLDEHKSPFVRSRWFSRGWTLQELLAPATLRFYDARWNLLGTKQTLFSLVSETTGIKKWYINTAPAGTRWNPRLVLSTVSVGEKMSWAAARKTTRVEDGAYCLLGIFDISMPMLYGEGERAFARLQEEIMKITDDCTLLAWNYRLGCESLGDSLQYHHHSILAPSPASFGQCHELVVRPIPGFGWPSFSMGQRGLNLRGPIVRDSRFGSLVYLLLACGEGWPDDIDPVLSRRARSWDLITVPLVSSRLTEGKTNRNSHEFLRATWCQPSVVTDGFAASATVEEIVIRRRPADLDLNTSSWAQLPFCMVFSPPVLNAYPPTPLNGGRAIGLSTVDSQVRVMHHLKRRDAREPVYCDSGKHLFLLNTLGVHLLLELEYELAEYEQLPPTTQNQDHHVVTKVYRLPWPVSLEYMQDWYNRESDSGIYRSRTPPRAAHQAEPASDGPAFLQSIAHASPNGLSSGVEIRRYSYEFGLYHGRKVALGIALARPLSVTTVEVGTIYVSDEPVVDAGGKQRSTQGKAPSPDLSDSVTNGFDLDRTSFAQKWKQWTDRPGGAWTQYFEGDAPVLDTSESGEEDDYAAV